jgi:hypothetical protein
MVGKESEIDSNTGVPLPLVESPSNETGNASDGNLNVSEIRIAENIRP